MEPEIKKTKHTCSSCRKGNLVIEITRICIAPPGHATLGPGGKKDWRNEEKIYCESCALSYHRLPKRKELNIPNP